MTQRTPLANAPIANAVDGTGWVAGIERPGIGVISAASTPENPTVHWLTGDELGNLPVGTELTLAAWVDRENTGFGFSHWGAPGTLIDGSREPLETLTVPATPSPNSEGVSIVAWFYDGYKYLPGNTGFPFSITTKPLHGAKEIWPYGNPGSYRMIAGPRGAMVDLSAQGPTVGGWGFWEDWGRSTGNYRSSVRVILGPGEHGLITNPLRPDSLGGGQLTVIVRQSKGGILGGTVGAPVSFDGPIGGPSDALFRIGAGPNPGFEFAGWADGDPSGPVRQVQGPPDMKEFEAVFARRAEYTLELDTGSSDENAVPGALEIGNAKAYYAPGEEVTLTATEFPGYRFERWEGYAQGGDGFPFDVSVFSPLTIVMDADTELTAVFREFAPTLNAPDLWFFNGENPKETYYPISGTIVASGAPTCGYFQFKVTAGADKVDLKIGSDPAGDVVSKANSGVDVPNAVQVISTAMSDEPGDIRIEYYWSATDSDYQKMAEVLLSVRAPYRLEWKPVPFTINDEYFHDEEFPGTKHSGLQGGFISKIAYHLYDNLGNVIKALEFGGIDNILPCNEMFPVDQMDFDLNRTEKAQPIDDQASNWLIVGFDEPPGGQSGINAGTTAIGGGNTAVQTWPQWEDWIWVSYHVSQIPAPANPPNGVDSGICPSCTGAAVDHWGGYFYFGSTVVGRGVKVSAQTWQRFTDHALHTNFQSPAP